MTLWKHIIQVLSFFINKHAPLQRKSITLRLNVPWYTEERRKAELLWRKTKLEIHHQLFKERCRELGKLLMRSKRTYYSDKIAECGNSKKCLFRITKNLMGHKGELYLPSCSSDERLAYKFSDFFMRKITTIRDDIDNHKPPISDPVVMSANIKSDLPLKTRYVKLSLRLPQNPVNYTHYLHAC